MILTLTILLFVILLILLGEQFAELVHTQEGSDVACNLIALANAKERKVIIRGLKTHTNELIKMNMVISF